MIINDNKLDVKEFKEIFESISWIKLPRNLGKNHSEFFYSGKYETDDKKISITLRPSMVMAISETFKNRHPSDGSIPTESYRGPLVEWGGTIEVLMDAKFLKAVEKLAKPLMPREETQTISW